MIPTVLRIFSLLLGMGTVLLGTGLLGTLLGVRGGMEAFSERLLGAVMAAYFLGFVSGAWLCPPLIARVGRIRAFAAMSALACVCALAHGLFIDPAIWMVLRFVVGVCLMGLYLVVESWLNAQTEPGRRGRTFALYMTVNLLAMGLAQFLLLAYGAGELASFVLAGMFCALALVPIALTRMVEPAPTRAPTLDLRHLLGTSPLGTAGALLTGLGNGAFWGLGPVFAQRMGYAEPGIALFMASVIVGGALLQIPIGHLSDRRDRRAVTAGVCFAAAAATAGVWAGADRSLGLLLGSAAAYGGFSFSVYSLVVAHTNDHVGAGDALETARGLLLLNGLGACLGPLLAGWAMYRYGPGALLAHIGLTLVLLGLFALQRMRTGAVIPVAAQADFVPMARTGTEVFELDPRTEAGAADGEAEAAPAGVQAAGAAATRDAG